MNKHLKKPRNEEMYKAILTLNTVEELMKFFDDLCTVSELQAMEQRYQVAVLLSEGMIYNDILEKTGASSATISRVNRSLAVRRGRLQRSLPPSEGTASGRREGSGRKMSQCYGPLAARYDALTGDVPYEALETWYETAFAHSGRAVHTGFGSLLRHGYALAASG